MAKSLYKKKGIFYYFCMVLAFFIVIYVLLTTRFDNPQMTETQLFLEFWFYYLSTSILALGIAYIGILVDDRRIL